MHSRHNLHYKLHMRARPHTFLSKAAGCAPAEDFRDVDPSRNWVTHYLIPGSRLVARGRAMAPRISERWPRNFQGNQGFDA